jgi:hypothetical protein
VRIDEARCAVDHIHSIASQLIFDDSDLVRDDVIRTEGEVFDGDRGLQPVAGPIQIPLPKAGEVQHGFTQRLARNRAGINADAAHHNLPLDDADLMAELRSLNGGFLTGWPCADDEKVVMSHPDPR